MNRFDFPRRSFLGGLLSACGGALLPADAFGAEAPRLRLGVLSDIHIGADASSHQIDTDKRFGAALRWLDAEHVDAVMVPGDIAHSGLVSEFVRFAKAWNAVFPKNRGSDGRPVEKLFVTGNHDLEAFWVKGTDEWRTKNVFNHGDNPRRIWRELFGEDYELIWKKTVKGYVFIGSQWPCRDQKPPVEAWFAEHGRELDPRRPFFYVQHAHPRGTCGDGKISTDDGTATRALSAFPNAVAITGHSHQTIVDESSVWQGAFTSVNAGCLRSAGNDRWGMGYDSIAPGYSPKRKENRMIPLDGREGGCGLLVDVYDDHLVIHRRSLAHGCALGADWCVALPAAAGGPFDPARQRAADAGPVFVRGATPTAERCATAPKDIAGPALVGRPCVWLKIPHPLPAKPGARVYDFVVELLVDGRPRLKRLVLANGYNVPEELSARMTNCLFAREEMPSAGTVSFRVTPRTSFGTPGPALEVML